MRSRGMAWLVPWLLAAAAVQVAAVEVVRRVFVGTARGQLLDTAALDGHTIGQRHIEGVVGGVLDAMSVLSLAAATVTIGFIALMRRRAVLAAVAMLLIAGANLTTQLLKYLTERPDYGVDLARAAAGNSLPSGHTTVAASVAVALVLVVPPRVRGLAAVVGAGYAALAGVATMSAGWHRPSDAVAALLIVGAWAAVGGLVLVVVGTGHPRESAAASAPARAPHRPAMVILVAGGIVALAVAALAMALTDRALSPPDELLGRGRVLTAYAGGAAGIAGMTSMVMALVLATVHRVVPAYDGLSSGRPGQPGGAAAGRSTAPARSG